MLFTTLRDVSSTNSTDNVGGGGTSTRNSDSAGGGGNRERGDGANVVGPVPQQTSTASTTLPPASTMGSSGAANNVGPGSPRDSSFAFSPSTGLTQPPNGVYTNARFMHAVAALVVSIDIDIYSFTHIILFSLFNAISPAMLSPSQTNILVDDLLQLCQYAISNERILYSSF